MRSSVESRTTRTSPCLRRKLEISSAGVGSAAHTIEADNASREAAASAAIAREVIVVESPGSANQGGRHDGGVGWRAARALTGTAANLSRDCNIFGAIIAD